MVMSVNNHYAWAHCPTPPSLTDCSTKIATTEWVGPHIIEKYINGTEWYRVWSDGWIEQGGVGTSHQYNTTAVNVNFLKPYKDTNYSVMVSCGATTQQSWQIAVRIGIKYTTGLDVRGGSNANAGYTGQFHWYACGY